ncbi:GTPase and tRNA-U34 5-formylation enzyme TrmE [Helicobacter heilmannii]|uniref:tRNA uridine-5-carboxymethylaminomethyl(34) synthesis GTPase MnmE n=1 Tax=Helicobacter heilmannii TaxID=35817 RepID=UPI0006A006CC|nr:tRNA uridine-5-carboxymethylaminomethyl(34) synthesis GTPase MnmE [Helicobacter heilmannii]CRF47187.1 GTPase and tRNA-U34 5-formylation enzyme TrmE [Helicobacter heilmannii]
MTDTIAAIATPPAQGAIAIVKLSGTKSLEILQTLTHRQHFPPRRAILVDCYEGKDLLDQALALYFEAPHSYTGEDVAEIQCHGGLLVARLVLEACLKAGARLATSGEFSKRAFFNGRMDLSQIQALQQLIESQNVSMAKVMAKQLKGGLKDFVQTVRTALLELIATAEVLIDYGEEDLPVNLPESLRAKMRPTLEKLQHTLEVSKAKKAQLEGYTLSIVGKPNVGKSSLLNALLLQERAIVSPLAGTTRDTIEEVVYLNGSYVRLVDTAGIREGADMVESLGISRSKARMQESQIILALFDLSHALDAQDMHILDLLAEQQDKDILVILNKSDCVQRLDTNTLLEKLPFLKAPPLVLSTKKSPCLPLIQEALAPFMQTDLPDVILPALNQQEALEATIAHLQSAQKPLKSLELELFAYHIKDALESLARLAGPYNTEEMLGVMFSKFCLGK